MYALIENNQIVKTSANARVFFPNTSFPASGPTAQFLADNGVKTVVDGERKDERFYWVTPANPAIQLVNGVPTRVYTNTAKELEDREEVDEEGNSLYVKVLGEVNGEPAMVDSEEKLITKGLKTQWINQVKDNANKELAATDWYVIRKAERDVAIPQEIIDARAAIISACTAKEAAITAATTVDELKEVLFSTPQNELSE